MIFKETYDSFWIFYASVDLLNDFLMGFYDLLGKEKPTDRKFYFCFLMKQLCIGLWKCLWFLTKILWFFNEVFFKREFYDFLSGKYVFFNDSKGRIINFINSIINKS